MGTISEKLTYLNDTKQLLKDSINSLGGNITSQTTFRQYATELDSIYSSLPKVSGTGSDISLSPTLKGRLGSVLKGNTLQDGTPTPDNPVEIQSATGLQTITISDGTNTQTKELNLGNIKLNKIGDYQDYITGTPNNWSIKRQIRSVVLDDSEIWFGPGYELTNSNRFYSSSYLSDSVQNIALSNKFQSVNAVTINNTDSEALCRINEKQIAIRLNKSRATTLEGFKTWLSNNNVEVYYVLTTETTEPITNQEIINQLNEIYYLQSYNGTTNITITSEDLELIMTASAIKGEA